MRRRPLILASVSLLVLSMAFGLVSPATAQETPPDRVEMQKRFDEALKLYNQGEYAKTAEIMDEILKMNPSSHEALVLREKAGMGLLVKMLREPSLRDSATKILRKAASEAERIQRDPETIAGLIAKLDSEEIIQREAAIRHLAAAGPFAAPGLLDAALSSPDAVPTHMAVGAVRALRAMGPSGTLPLLTALRNSPPEAAIRICRILGQTPDARAIAPLMAVAQDPASPQPLRQAALGALNTMIVDVPPAPPAPAAPVAKGAKGAKGAKDVPAAKEQPRGPALDAGGAYLSLAQRYYYSDPTLVELLPVWERVIWLWKPEGKSFAERLTYQNVPLDVYPRAMSEQMLFAGMQAPGAHPDFLELYVSNNYMRHEEALAVDKDRAQQLQAVDAINESLGRGPLYRSLARALKDGNTVLARRCIEGLRHVGDPRAPEGQNSLATAMNYPDKLVRASAAETLMRLSPLGGLGNTQEVITTTASALGAVIRPRILVLTTDPTLYNPLARDLRAWDMDPESRKDQAEAMQRIRSMVPPINLFLVDVRLSGASAEGLVTLLRKDPVYEKLPVILLVPAADAEKWKPMAGSVSAVLTLPADADSIKAAVNTALAAGASPASAAVMENTEMVLRLLGAVAALPPNTQYPAGTLSETVVRLVKGYPNDIRASALQAVGNLGQPRPRDAVMQIYADAKEPAELRHVAGEALLRLLPVNPVVDDAQRETLRQLTADADETLRAQAIHALSMAQTAQSLREARLVKEIGVLLPATE